jgi:hypothetical protein
MAVILVLCTFAVFLIIDAFLSRHKTAHMVAASEPQAVPEVEADYIDGFHVPAALQYHPGHAWVQRERRMRRLYSKAL